MKSLQVIKSENEIEAERRLARNREQFAREQPDLRDALEQVLRLSRIIKLCSVPWEHQRTVQGEWSRAIDFLQAMGEKHGYGTRLPEREE